MTVKVAGLWELGWFAPLTEADLWSYMLRDFQVDEWYMAPVSGIATKVSEVSDIGQVLEKNRGLTKVFIDERGDTPLAELEHPEHALYLTGKNGRSLLQLRDVDSDDIAVRVETPQTDGLLWAHQALAIVLYDRFQKAQE